MKTNEGKLGNLSKSLKIESSWSRTIRISLPFRKPISEDAGCDVNPNRDWGADIPVELGFIGALGNDA